MAQILGVVGLGAGDEGKGATVDFLCRREKARLVVRYNGGHQAGHNVTLPDGTHHTFAQFGSGTFAGARTHLSRFMVIEPKALRNEADALCKHGHILSNPLDLLTVDRECLVTTVYEKAANRLREEARGAGRHGSCGVGVGETVEDARDFPAWAIRAGDLTDAPTLVQKLWFIQERKIEQLREAGIPIPPKSRLCDNRQDRYSEATFLRDCAEPLRLVDSTWLDAELRSPGAVVFEGAQGVLLDKKWGFFPHCTWSDCTFENGWILIRANDDVSIYGVTRAYATRHGPGPLVSEDPEPLSEQHNAFGQYQGAFRTGALDLVTLDYAIQLTRPGRLVVNHLDRIQPGPVRVCTGYVPAEGDRDYFCRSEELGYSRIRTATEDRHRTAALMRAKPVWGEFSREDLETELCGVPVEIIGEGPTHEKRRTARP